MSTERKFPGTVSHVRRTLYETRRAKFGGVNGKVASQKNIRHKCQNQECSAKNASRKLVGPD